MAGKRKLIDEVLRKAVADDPRTMNAFAKDAGIKSPINLWRFVDGKDVALATAAKIADALGMELRKIEK